MKKMQILTVIFFLQVFITTNCIKNHESTGSHLKLKRIHKSLKFIETSTDNCPQVSEIIPGHENGYCMDYYTNTTMKADCRDFDDNCDICFTKDYLEKCVEVCDTNQLCPPPPMLSEICKNNKHCVQCYFKAKSCLMCPKGLETVIHANHTKQCQIEDCPDGQYHPVEGCSRCNECSKGCDKCSACDTCEPGSCQTNGFCSQGEKCEKKEDTKSKICSASDEYVSVNNAEWKKARYSGGNDGNCGEVACVKDYDCGQGYFANKVTGWCELCDYPYGEECSGPSPKDNAKPFCWKKDEQQCITRGDKDCLQNYFFEEKDGKKNCYKSCEDTPVATFATGLEDTNVALCDPNTEHCFCVACHTGIKKCSGRNADDAIECMTDLKLTESGTCVADCGPGYYAEQCPNTKIEKCFRCHKSCATCTNGAANSCETCKTPEFVPGGVHGEPGVCYPTEQVGEFADFMRANTPK